MYVETLSRGDPVGREHLPEPRLLTDAPRRFQGVRNPVPILDGQPGGRVQADMIGGSPPPGSSTSDSHPSPTGIFTFR